MGFFHAINQWFEQRNKKRIEHCESQGICPECHGRGFNMLDSEYFWAGSHYDYNCLSCNGSGSYADWVETIVMEF